MSDDKPAPSFSLISFSGKSGERLLEVARQIFGDVFERHRIPRKAQAEAEAALIRAQAGIDLEDIRQRAVARFEAQEVRRQRNLESIFGGAVPLLPESVADTRPDPDWVTEFRKSSQDTSAEEVQALWSKILAMEVEKPGRFSRRTLIEVGRINRLEAELFARWCCYTLIDPAGVRVQLEPTGFRGAITGIPVLELHRLAEVGLVAAVHVTPQIN